MKASKKYQPKHKADGTFKKVKLNKYNAKGQRIDGHWFASKAEAVRYEQLKEMIKLRMIEPNLKLQPSFQLHVHGVLIATYRADFEYEMITEGGKRLIIIEDVKGMILPEYKMKKKLAQAIHNIIITEVPSSKIEKMRMVTGDLIPQKK